MLSLMKPHSDNQSINCIPLRII